MINTLSKLSSISQKHSASYIRFNSSLPITITVLEELPLNRYNLLLGNREFTTKSHKPLKKGMKYWGNFGEGKDGVITISGLLQKPSFLQDEDEFLDVDIKDFFTKFQTLEFPTRYFKNWLLENMAVSEIPKSIFKSLSNMLLALNDGIIHLPFKSYDKPILVQFQASFENELRFYLAYDNLGPIKGFLSKKNNQFELLIDVLFEKSFFFLKRELETLQIPCFIKLNKEIAPLYEIDKMMLDIRG